MTDALIQASAVAIDGAGGAAKWLRLLPAGKFNCRDGRGPFNAGGLAEMQAIVRRSLDYAGETDLMVDYDHQAASLLSGKYHGRAEAAGWIVDLQARRDGIYGLIEWTAAAAEKINNREYRYISPYFGKSKNGAVTAIMNVALVNMPALDLVAASWKLTMPKNDDAATLAELLTLLELPGEAGISDVLAAVRVLKSEKASATAPDPAKFVSIDLFQAAVADANSLRQGVSDKAARDHVTAAINNGLLMPAMEEWAVELCRSNVPAFDAFIEGTGPALHRIVGTSQFERSGSLTRRPPRDEALSNIEQEIAANLSLSTSQFVAARASDFIPER